MPPPTRSTTRSTAPATVSWPRTQPSSTSGLPTTTARRCDSSSWCSSPAFFPGLTPTREQLAAERDRRLADKQGVELAQGLLAAHVLAAPQPAATCWDDAAADPEAVQRLDELRATGNVDFGFTHVARTRPSRDPRAPQPPPPQRRGRPHAGPDRVGGGPDPARSRDRGRRDAGGLVDHPKYAGDRVFSSGINLTHLYHGRIDFMFYLVRDLAYVNKLYRGVGTPAGPVEKLWVAAVERFAIGGGCQLLHVVDHVIAARGSRLYLPARKEGIIPGASNLRLPRFVGDRAARQAILSGREWTAGEPDADLICDEVVDPAEVDGALDARARGTDQLRPDQRRRQPAGAARRPGAARPVSRVHGDLRARAGLLPPQPGAGGESRDPLECPPALRSEPRDLGRSRDAASRSDPSLQLERLRAAVGACWVRTARRPAAGRRRDRRARRCRLAERPRADPVHDQGRPARRAIRSGCWQCPASSSSASTPRAVPAASRPSSRYTAGDLDTWTELMARSMTMAGVRPEMLIHNANGYGLFTGGLGFHQGGERIGATVVPVSAGFTARQAELLVDLAADVLVATPSYSLVIAQARRWRRAPTRRRCTEVGTARRRALERGAARRDRARAGAEGDQLLRAVRDVRPRRRHRMPGRARRTACAGGPLHRGGARSRTPAIRCRRGPRASWC